MCQPSPCSFDVFNFPFRACFTQHRGSAHTERTHPQCHGSTQEYQSDPKALSLPSNTSPRGAARPEVLKGGYRRLWGRCCRPRAGGAQRLPFPALLPTPPRSLAALQGLIHSRVTNMQMASFAWA